MYPTWKRSEMHKNTNETWELLLPAPWSSLCLILKFQQYIYFTIQDLFGFSLEIMVKLGIGILGSKCT